MTVVAMVSLVALVSIQLASASGTGGQIALGTPTLAAASVNGCPGVAPNGCVIVPVNTTASTSPYSGFNAHLLFPGATQLSFVTMASGGALETSGGSVSCVSVSTDSGNGATGSCNISGVQNTLSAGTLGKFVLRKQVPAGCATIHLFTFGPPDNGNSSTGTYTINSADSTVQSNTYGTTTLTVDLATGATGCAPLSVGGIAHAPARVASRDAIPLESGHSSFRTTMAIAAVVAGLTAATLGAWQGRKKWHRRP